MDYMSTLNDSLPESHEHYDRETELKAFDESKAGVKGLVDSGAVHVPKIFIRPPHELVEELSYVESNLRVPVIDLARINESGDGRRRIVSEVKRASKEWGFFQVVNHGIESGVLDGMIDGVRRFHEQDVEEKKKFHSRDAVQKVKYGSNVDLYRSRAANWRDSLTVALQMSDRVEPEELPEICRDSTINYLNEVTKLGDTLFELLSEALGLKSDHLGSIECAKGRTFIGHYYPPCPEPELTMGTSKHTDPSFLTVLLQDQIGGLQVLHQEQYVNVQPLPGSLVVNIGDMLQMISNDEFISTDHRVVANKVGPRISVAGFFSGSSLPGKIYGPIKELISEENPPKYMEFTVRDYINKFFARPIDKSGLDDFRMQAETNPLHNVV